MARSTRGGAAAPRGPVSVAVVNDFDLVVNGVRALLSGFEDRVAVVETAAATLPVETVDIALYDAFSMEGVPTRPIAALVGAANVAQVVIYTWTLRPSAVECALEHGASGVLSKTLTAAQLVEALEAIRGGRRVISAPVGDDEPLPGVWPGKLEGLTARESEVIALIVQGLSNQDIADRLFLSINSVKSYIRNAYRTMGVSSRSRAVLWGLEHGMRSVPVSRRGVVLGATPLPPNVTERR